MIRLVIRVLSMVCAVGLAACSSAPAASTSPGGTASAPPTGVAPAPSTASTGAAPASCPNPDGGSCLGPISAGTYTIKIFDPTITYTVPDGWSNFEDTPGNFLLVPPGYDLAGVNADTGDFVGVYATVAAPNGCDPGTAPGVGFKPADLKDWYERNPGLVVTSNATTVGGRKGFILEIRMRDTWKEACPYSNGHPIVPLLVGTGRTGLDHNIGAGRAWRLYLLDNGDGTMAIEVVDIADAGHLAEYAKIVEGMVFGGSSATTTAACLGVVGGTSGTIQVSVDGQQRQVLVHVPSSGPTQSHDTPVVMMFHGYGDTSKLAEDMTGLSSRADAADFIVVYPQAAGERPRWDVAGTSDTDFVGALLMNLSADPCVDPTRIFAVGTSMGGAMANVVACRMADRIAALATVSGAYGPNWGDPRKPSRPVAVIAFHGLVDPIVPYGGGPIVDPDTGANQDLPPVIGAEAWAAGWAARDGCVAKAQPQTKIGRVQPLFWIGCVAPVEFYRLADGGHTWPGSSWDEPLTNRDVSATDLIWAFVKSFSVPNH